MKKFSFLIIFLFFILTVGAVASEDVEDSKAQIDLIINVMDFGDYLELSVDLPSDAQGTVNYTVSNQKFEVGIVNGEAKVNVSDLEPGQYVVKAVYSGDDTYGDAENQTIVFISAPEDTNTSANASGEPDENQTPVENTTPKNDTPVNNTTVKNDTPVNNTTVKNETPVANTTPVKNDTTDTQNKTPVTNNTTTYNVTTTVDKPPKEPKKPEPWKVDAKTGLPILLVIIAIVILVVVRKYNF